MVQNRSLPQKKPVRNGLGHENGTKRAKNRSKPFCNRSVTVFCVWEKPKRPQNQKNRSGTVRDRSLPQRNRSGTVWGTRTARNGTERLSWGSESRFSQHRTAASKKLPRLTKLPCRKTLIKNGPGPFRASKPTENGSGLREPKTLQANPNPNPQSCMYAGPRCYGSL